MVEDAKRDILHIFPFHEQQPKTKGESSKLSYLLLYSFFQYWLIERKYNIVEVVEDVEDMS